MCCRLLRILHRQKQPLHCMLPPWTVRAKVEWGEPGCVHLSAWAGRGNPSHSIHRTGTVYEGLCLAWTDSSTAFPWRMPGLTHWLHGKARANPTLNPNPALRSIINPYHSASTRGHEQSVQSQKIRHHGVNPRMLLNTLCARAWEITGGSNNVTTKHHTCKHHQYKQFFPWGWKQANFPHPLCQQVELQKDTEQGEHYRIKFPSLVQKWQSRQEDLGEQKSKVAISLSFPIYLLHSCSLHLFLRVPGSVRSQELPILKIIIYLKNKIKFCCPRNKWKSSWSDCSGLEKAWRSNIPSPSFTPRARILPNKKSKGRKGNKRILMSSNVSCA